MITVREAAAIWSVADATIRQYILAGKFQPGEVRKSGGTWLIKKNAILRVLGLPKKPKKK